jgi:hypothetical protein
MARLAECTTEPTNTEDAPARSRRTREQPGNEAIFDQALTNGLAAIVERRWAGEETAGNRVKSASQLLDVITARGRGVEDGVVELPDLDPPPEGFVFGGDPTPTRVKTASLREAIRITQRPRHARLV